MIRGGSKAGFIKRNTKTRSFYYDDDYDNDVDKGLSALRAVLSAASQLFNVLITTMTMTMTKNGEVKNTEICGNLFQNNNVRC